MVMETPGPQEVGREFVRQYYTMLHEAPLHLHRFYSNNSAFVHGGIEKAGCEQPPVIGQEAIHKKIVSLNFNDCHAKIRQVDAQATIGDSVVVQVTGELSNNGEPMRRFMQTFVLVPQTPKKFYVHNDIFRYQDEVFHDEEGEVEEAENSGFSTDLHEENIENENMQDSNSVSVDVITSYYEQESISNSTTPEVDPLQNTEPTLNLVPSVTTKSQPETVPVTEREVGGLKDSANKEADMFEEKVEIKHSPLTEYQPTDFHEAQSDSKPVTWAALASKNTAGSMVPAANSYSAQTVSHVSKPPPARSDFTKADGVQHNTRVARVPRQRANDHDKVSMSHVDSDGDADSVSGRRSNSVGGGSRYSDSQQLFVGNLPHNITEAELKLFFENYGNVAELRINTKGTGKVPYFGFVVFESAETVQKILDLKAVQPIKFHGDHRLNVEKKKARSADGMRLTGRGGSNRGGGQGFANRSGGQTYSSGRGGMKVASSFNNRQDMRGSSNPSSRGGLSQQGRH